MEKQMKHMIELYKQKRFQVNSDNNMDVDSRNVQRQVRQGRVLLLCDCNNHTKFCNSPAICRHKQFFMVYPILNHFFKKIEKLEIEYKNRLLCSDKKEKELYEYFLDDLKQLKDLGESDQCKR